MLLKRVQVGLIHVAIAMTLVPINSTLNRIMIKELALSATLVAFLASLPYLFSPIQVFIGAFSDRHPLLGFRRSPYILLGLILCVLGVALAPQAAFLMAENWWAGLGLAILTFGAWGMGYNFASVSYFSLASELTGEKGRSRTVAIMFFMMIVSIIMTAIGLSQLLESYTPETLERSFWVVAAVALVLGLLGLAGLEKRSARPPKQAAEATSLAETIKPLLHNRQALLFFAYLLLLLAAILGQDVLLEPFAGEAFAMPVQTTTRITSIWGVCVLASIFVESLLERRISKRKVAKVGAWGAILAFVLLAASGVSRSTSIFYSGVILLGLATGLATISNLSLMLDMTVAGKVGLFMGAWGMANAGARWLGSMTSATLRDVISLFADNPVAGYVAVFGLEAVMLVASLILLQKVNVDLFRKQANEAPSLAERAAIANEAS